MTYPRRLIVPPDAPGTYHCVSRCVRRAFLCGQDTVTGRSFEHRKQWLEDRILQLGNLFAVAVHAYAVMSNHLHVVLEVDPLAPSHWSDEEVARRWLALCTPGGEDGPPLESRIRNLAAQSERLAVLRQRLGSLSWFMRFLKEPIAREANREDGCTGRFWEGRFKTQALLDDPAVLACMVYVDLNPLRAGLETSPEEAPHTSLRRRSTTAQSTNTRLEPLAGSIRSELPELTLRAYREVVNWTNGNLHASSKPPMIGTIPATMRKLHMRPDQWLTQVPATESRFWRAIGSSKALIELASDLGQRWIRGVSTARAFERLPDTS
jgi:hypothetical protein